MLCLCDLPVPHESMVINHAGSLRNMGCYKRHRANFACMGVAQFIQAQQQTLAEQVANLRVMQKINPSQNLAGESSCCNLAYA